VHCEWEQLPFEKLHELLALAKDFKEELVQAKLAGKQQVVVREKGPKRMKLREREPW
jgi:hypothetical protein